MNSGSPGTLAELPSFQSALACSMRSLHDDTKFHQIWRCAVHRRAAQQHHLRRRAGHDLRRLPRSSTARSPTPSRRSPRRRPPRRRHRRHARHVRPTSRSWRPAANSARHRRSARNGSWAPGGRHSCRRSAGATRRPLATPAASPPRHARRRAPPPRGSWAAPPRSGCRACESRCGASPGSVRSLWAMPAPAVIQLTSPGRIACA